MILHVNKDQVNNLCLTNNKNKPKQPPTVEEETL